MNFFNVANYIHSAQRDCHPHNHTHTQTQVTQHGEQRRSYEADMMILRAQVDEADMKTGIAESKLQHQLNVHGQEVAELKRKIKEFVS